MSLHSILFSTNLGSISTLMVRFTVEKCSWDIFAVSLVYFVSAIEVLGCDCLIYWTTSFLFLI